MLLSCHRVLEGLNEHHLKSNVCCGILKTFCDNLALVIIVDLLDLFWASQLKVARHQLRLRNNPYAAQFFGLVKGLIDLVDDLSELFEIILSHKLLALHLAVNLEFSQAQLLLYGLIYPIDLFSNSLKLSIDIKGFLIFLLTKSD